MPATSRKHDAGFHDAPGGSDASSRLESVPVLSFGQVAESAVVANRPGRPSVREIKAMMAERHLRSKLLLLVAVPFGLGLVAWAQCAGAIPTERLFDALGVREGMTVCEVGAGDGELSLAAARLVGPGGRVFTNELGEENVRSLRNRVDRSGLAHVTVVAGDPARTNFPDGACDAVFMRNVYHHFDDPAAMNASMAASLKPSGRLAVVDFPPSGAEAGQAADRDGSRHGVTPESVSRELVAAGFELVSSEADRRWFLVVVAKPG